MGASEAAEHAPAEDEEAPGPRTGTGLPAGNAEGAF